LSISFSDVVHSLIPTSRYYPLRFHCVRSLLRLASRTGTLIPIAPFLLEVLGCSELKRKPKPSTLKPLDFEYYIRAPAQYLRTRTYADGLAEEVSFLLVEHFASLSASIAFPELVLPVLVTLKRQVKNKGGGANPKLTGLLKTLVEKMEQNKKWVEERREKVEFAPGQRDSVERYEAEAEADKEKTPLGTYARLQRKLRDQRRALLEKAVSPAFSSLFVVALR
jgi:nucleolar complex protein 2